MGPLPSTGTELRFAVASCNGRLLCSINFPFETHISCIPNQPCIGSDHLTTRHLPEVIPNLLSLLHSVNKEKSRNWPSHLMFQICLQTHRITRRIAHSNNPPPQRSPKPPPKQ